MIDAFIQNIIEKDYASANKSLQGVVNTKIQEQILEEGINQEIKKKWYETNDKKEVDNWYTIFQDLKGGQNSVVKGPERLFNRWIDKPFEEFKSFVKELQKRIKPISKTPVLERFETYLSMTLEEREKIGINDILNDDDYFVAEITSWEGTKAIGTGTTWCISGKEGNFHWQRYQKNDAIKFIYILDKKLYEREFKKIKGQRGMDKESRMKLPQPERVNALYKIMFVLQPDLPNIYTEEGIAVFVFDTAAFATEYKDAENKNLVIPHVDLIAKTLTTEHGVPESVFKAAPASRNNYFKIDENRELVSIEDEFFESKGRNRSLAVHYQFLVDNNIKKVSFYTKNRIIYKGDKHITNTDVFFEISRHKEYLHDFIEGNVPYTEDIDVSKLFDYSKYLEGYYDEGLEGQLREAGYTIFQEIRHLDKHSFFQESNERRKKNIIEQNKKIKELGYSFEYIIKEYNEMVWDFTLESIIGLLKNNGAEELIEPLFGK